MPCAARGVGIFSASSTAQPSLFGFSRPSVAFQFGSLVPGEACGVGHTSPGFQRVLHASTKDFGPFFLFAPDWGAQRIFNLYAAWNAQLRRILAGFGLTSIRDLLGRTEFLTHLDYDSSELPSNA